MARKYIEYAIQRELIKKLHNQKLEAYWNKNEGKNSKFAAALDKKTGLVSGRPDMDIWETIQTKSFVLHLELKKLKGFLTPEQIKWHNNFIPTETRSAGVAYGLAGALNLIEIWRLYIRNKYT